MVLEIEDTKRDINPTKPLKNGWNAAIFIICVEMAERFAFFGLGTNLILYLTNELGETMATAAKNVNQWAGVTYLLPLVGAFLADSFFGRFNTILVASIIYCAGMALLSLSVSVIPWQVRKVWFFVSLYVIAVGQGGHKPCLVTFAADQFADDTVEEKKTKSSFFNWWFLGIAVGGSFAMFVVSYVQDKVGWGAAFGLMAGAMGLALVVFLVGSGKYRRESPKGSPLTSVAQVVVAAVRNRNTPETRYGNNVRTDNQFRFLDKAITSDEAVKDPWRHCSQSQADEVKQLLRLVPIWLCCLSFTVVNSFVATFFTKQATTVIRTVGSSGFSIPPASLQTVIGVTVLVTIPIYDRIIVPTARKFTKKPSGITVLQRIGVGLFFSGLTMVTSALVEGKRVNAAREHALLDSPKAEIPIRVWWLLPQYVFSGLSDAFTFVGLQELFYAQMPPPMRSLGSAASLSITGIGSFVSSGVISLVQVISAKQGCCAWLGDNINRAHLDYFYWVMALFSGLNLCVYVWVSSGFVYKRVILEEEREELQNI